MTAARAASEALLAGLDSDDSDDPESTYLPEDRGPISNSDVRWAISRIRDVGLLDEVESWRAEHVNTTIGRKVAIPTEAVLVAMLLAALDERAPLVREWERVLFTRISHQMRTELGITQPYPEPTLETAKARRARVAAYKSLRMAVRRILDETEPVPFPKRARMTESEWNDLVEAADPDDVARRWERLDKLSNTIIEISVRTANRALRRQIEKHWRGSGSVDATPSRVCARGTSRQSQLMSIDPTAWWYRRDGDHRDPRIDENGLPKPGKDNTYRNPKFDRTKDKLFFAHDITLVTMQPDSVDQPRLFPLLCMGIAVDKPGVKPAEHAIRVLNNIAGRGYPAGWMVGDSLYGPGTKPEKYQIPLAELGYKIVIEYTSSQLGLQGSYKGHKMVEGRWYSACTPAALINATIDYHRPKGDPERIEAGTFHRRIAARKLFESRPLGAGSKSGAIAMGCIASDPNPLAACELKPGSRRIDPKKMRVTSVPDVLEECCTNKKSTNFPKHLGAKHRQELRYMSPEWKAIKSLLRSSTEGKHGEFKDEAHEALGSPTRRRMHGLGPAHVYTALAAFALNIRKTRAFKRDAIETPEGDLIVPQGRRADWTQIATDAIEADTDPDEAPPPIAA